MWRIFGLSVLAWASMVGMARADGFVPDDPPATARICPAAAGDVLASIRDPSLQRWWVTVSEDGGPARRVTPRFPPRDGGLCPRVAAAADGTAAVAVESHVVVRLPGGRFGAAVRIDPPLEIEHVAVAPGGLVALVGHRFGVAGRELVAATLAPGGRPELAVLEREADMDTHGAKVGIDATGNVTAAWIRSPSYGRASVRAARRSGGAWEPAQKLGPVALPGGEVDGSQLDLAVSPAGRSLLAWADRDGILASADGAAAQRLVAERRTGYPSVAVDDGGAATVAFAARSGAVLVLGRAGAGTWTPPVSVFAGSRVLRSERLLETPLASVLAPDGRAVVAWTTADEFGVHARAAWGRAGGAWAPSRRLSAITRAAESPAAWLDGHGVPHVMWSERAEDTHTTRRRGARLVSDAEAGPPDTSAPVLTTSLPARSARTKTARLRLRIPVRCSEACDLRVRIVEPGGGASLQTVTRTLSAGRNAMLRFTTGWSFASRLLVDKIARRPQIELVAADRAGNVTRVAQRFRVRVVDRPILGYRVGPRHDFAMFTRAGNRAVGMLVNDLIAGIASGAYHTERALRRRYRAGLRAIDRAGIDDAVYDTEVGDAIFEAIFVPCIRKGFDPEAVMG